MYSMYVQLKELYTIVQYLEFSMQVFILRQILLNSVTTIDHIQTAETGHYCVISLGNRPYSNSSRTFYHL